MITEIVQTSTGSYVRCASQSRMISTEIDILDLLVSCGEIDSNRILLDEEHLHPDFFDLSTGLAGAILLKLSTYHVKTAVVADLGGIKSPRFQELIWESNKGDQLRFFKDMKQAEKWLTTCRK